MQAILFSYVETVVTLTQLTYNTEVSKPSCTEGANVHL